MNSQCVNKIQNLRNQINTLIPSEADQSSLWSYLGWDDEASNHYTLAKAYGVDLRPIIAPIFSEVISLAIDGIYMEKGHDWYEILNGEDHYFPGNSPKECLLSVLDYILGKSEQGLFKN